MCRPLARDGKPPRPAAALLVDRECNIRLCQMRVLSSCSSVSQTAAASYQELVLLETVLLVVCHQPLQDLNCACQPVSSCAVSIVHSAVCVPVCCAVLCCVLCRFDTVYCDDNLRVAQDIRGDTLIVTRDGPPRIFT